MSTTKKTASGPVSASAAEKTHVIETIVTLYTTGVERVAEVQKTGIDLAVKQNADMLDAWKKIARAIPGAPGLFMLDLATNAFETYSDTQKGAIDLFVDQSHALAGLVKEGSTTSASTFDATAAVIQQGVVQSVVAQDKALDYTAAQTKAAFQAAKQKLGLTGKQVDEASELFQHGVDTLVETQRELLDLAAKPFTSVH